MVNKHHSVRRAGQAMLTLWLICSGLASCGAGTCPPAISRGAGLDVLGPAGALNTQQLTGSAPFTLGAALAATPGLLDTAHTGSALTVKSELDFGDGAGWTDVTMQQQALGTAWGTSLAQSVQHTYAAAGTYTLRGRVTYWDGKVMDAWNPCVVMVK